MPRRLVWILLAALLALTACQRGDRSGEEKLGPKAQAAGDKKPDENAEDAMNVYQGDTIVFELTVYHPPFVYLTGEPPVTVFAPSIVGWRFEKPVFKLDRDYFPMQIPVTLDRDAETGNVKVRLGLRIEFAYKSDEKTAWQNAVVEKSFNVGVQRGEKGGRRVRAPVEHMLQITDGIEQGPVQ